MSKTISDFPENWSPDRHWRFHLEQEKRENEKNGIRISLKHKTILLYNKHAILCSVKRTYVNLLRHTVG